MSLKLIALPAVLLFALCLRGAGVDNSALIPELLDDARVRLETPRPGAPATPDWVKSLIIVEVNIFTGSPDRTFAGMGRVLDHLAETGVNAIWLTPVNERPHYGNNGLHTLNSELTGTTDVPEQWRRVRAFVDEAHRRNIRVFLDVVSWGVTKKAPLYREKPEWFSGPSIPAYNGWFWDWTNRELREWFSSRLVDLIMMTGADGVRCDSAPGYGGYGIYRTARERLLSFGRKVVFISEHPSERRGVFDFDQLSFMYEKGGTGTRFPCRIFMEENIVDIVRSGRRMGSVDAQFDRAGITMDGGRERYYTFPLSCHDNRGALSQGDPIVFGYQALFSPYIPLWLLGEEWNNPVTVDGWLWRNPVRWEQLEPNRGFFELVKRMIRIRRSHPDIFEYFPADHRQANIGKVETDCPELLQPYVRFRNGVAILVVPNNGKEARTLRISIPYREAGLSASPVVVTDLLAGREIARGASSQLGAFEAAIPAGMLGLYKVAPAE
ncbi:MAG: hypothetical protein HPZ91_15965 [Lentisphaeria bacterium]|nr:hypothetical protein [Lentisphaeria bacterium]